MELLNGVGNSRVAACYRTQNRQERRYWKMEKIYGWPVHNSRISRVYRSALCVAVAMVLLTVASAQTPLSVDRLRLQAIYQGELGHFDKKRITSYLAYTGLDYGHEWCAAFVSYCFSQLGQVEPRTPWSPSLFPQRKQVWRNSLRATLPTAILPGMVWGIHIASKGRIGHVGFVDSYDQGMLTTVEGNTNDPDRRQPNGVYRKRRSWRTIKSLSDWLQADRESKTNKSNF